VFPVFDENGLITEIYGRKILNNLREGTAYHTYLPGPHKGFWNPQCLAAKACTEHGRSEIILCEAIIDALSFWVNGLHNVTAAYGVNGFTDEMLKAFIDHHIRKVYIAFDRDEAGDTAAERIAATLTGEGIECLRIQFPKGMDANEYACAVKPASKSLQVLINAAAWMGKRPAPAPVPALAHTPEPQPPAGLFPLAASLPLPEPLPAAEITIFLCREIFKLSDIDLLVVSSHFDGKINHEDVNRLWRLTAHTDSRVEPIPVGEKEWKEDDYRAIVEIARTEGQVVTVG
jgi:hypothetical protein